MHLFETTCTRHGIAVLGPTGSGKTTAIGCLRKTLAKTQQGEGSKQIHEVRVNAKCMTMGELYGCYDPHTHEWTTGVFSALWAKHNTSKNAHSAWLVLDSPLDAIGAERLNSVLDDNRTLVLANGDRIRMIDSVKLMFEATDFNVVSPATVSRCAVVWPRTMPHRK